MSESIDSDTEKKDLTAAHKTAKKALWNLLSIVNTERKMKIKQAIYHLEKALKQTTAQNPLQVQLQQLNAKMNTLLQKQDTATNTTQKVIKKTVEQI